MRRKNAEHIAEELEALGFMPERFITAYLEIVRVGMAVSVQAAKYDEHVAAAVKKRFHEHAGGLKDENTLRFKAWIDRRLREIGRDMQVYLNAKHGTFETPAQKRAARRVAKEMEKGVELKCKYCEKYVSWQWRFCSWCGKELDNGGEAGAALTAQAREDHTEQLPRTPRQDTERPDARCPGCGIVSTWEDHRCSGENQERRENPRNAEDAGHPEAAVISEERTGTG